MFSVTGKNKGSETHIVLSSWREKLAQSVQARKSDKQLIIKFEGMMSCFNNVWTK